MLEYCIILQKSHSSLFFLVKSIEIDIYEGNQITFIFLKHGKWTSNNCFQYFSHMCEKKLGYKYWSVGLPLLWSNLGYHNM